MFIVDLICEALISDTTTRVPATKRDKIWGISALLIGIVVYGFMLYCWIHIMFMGG